MTSTQTRYSHAVIAAVICAFLAAVLSAGVGAGQAFAANQAGEALTSGKVSTQAAQDWKKYIDPKTDSTSYTILPSNDATGETDRSAINNAMNGTNSTSGWDHRTKPITINFVAGATYYIDGTINLFDDVTINAHGATIKQVTNGKPIFINAHFIGSNNVFNMKPKSVKGYNRCKNISINGGTYITTGKPDPKAKKSKYGKYKHGYSCFLFMHAQNVHIDGATLVNNYNGHFIEFAGVKNSSITNVTIKGKYTGDSTNEAIQLDTNYNKANSPTGAPYDGTPCKNITIQNCNINVSKMSVGIGTNYQCKKTSSNIKILNNKIKVKKYAVALYKCKNITVKGNTFHKGKLYKHSTAKKVKASKNKQKKK